MGADASLVQGAYKAAMANVPKDYRAMYQNLTTSHSKTMQGFAGAVAGAVSAVVIAKEKKKKKLGVQSKKFSDKADELLTRLASYKKNESLNKKMFDQYFDKVQVAKNDFELVNAVGKSDSSDMQKSRHELYAKLEQYKNEVGQIRADFLTLGELEAAKQLNYEATGDENLAVFSEIIDLDGDHSNVNMEWDEKDSAWFSVDMTHVVDENEFLEDGTKNPDYMQPLYGEDDGTGKYIVKVKASDIMKKIITKAVGVEADITKIITDSYSSGKEVGGIDFDSKSTSDKINTAIKDEQTFADIANRRLEGHDMSWVDALESHPAISIMAYENIGVDASTIDTNSDGVIDKTEAQQLSAENQLAVIDVLTNINNPNFDLQLSRNEISNFFMLKAQDKFDNGRTARAIANNKNTNYGSGFKGANLGEGIGYQNAGQIDYFIDQTRDVQDGGTVDDLRGNKWTWDANENKFFIEGEGGEIYWKNKTELIDENKVGFRAKARKIDFSVDTKTTPLSSEETSATEAAEGDVSSVVTKENPWGIFSKDATINGKKVWGYNKITDVINSMQEVFPDFTFEQGKKSSPPSIRVTYIDANGKAHVMEYISNYNQLTNMKNWMDRKLRGVTKTGDPTLGG